MTTQSAVEFLYQHLQMKLSYEQRMQFEGLFQQAFDMEKEQIENAYEKGLMMVSMAMADMAQDMIMNQNMQVQKNTSTKPLPNEPL